MPGVRIALPHFVFEKANGGAATEAYEHQPRVVDDEKKQPEQEVSQRYEHGYAGPPPEGRVSGRKNAGQCPEQHQNGQYLPNSPVVENGKMHERAKIQPRTLKILCCSRLVYSRYSLTFAPALKLSQKTMLNNHYRIKFHFPQISQISQIFILKS